MASERAESPYRPGFSMPPAVLAGRDEILEDVDDAIATAALDNRMPTPLVLVGARGVGKTVLLEEIAQRAGARYGWPWLRVEMTDSTPFTPTLLSGGDQIRSLITQDRPRDRFKASDATFRAGLPGVGAEIHVTRESAPAAGDPLDLRLGLQGLAEVAREHDTGVVITFDELQLVDRAEMGRLGAALQLGISEQWPFVVALAGLDAVRQPGLLPTYFERANWHTLDVLDEQSAARALAGPADAAGRPFDADAVTYLAEATGGYPFAIQLYGHHAWRASHGKATIDLAAAQQAAETGNLRLAKNLYAQRWRQAAPRERDYLIAAAEEYTAHGTITSSAIATRMHATRTQQLAPIRARLLSKGTLVSDGHELHFAVPGMAAFVLSMREAPSDAGPPGDRQLER